MSEKVSAGPQWPSERDNAVRTARRPAGLRLWLPLAIAIIQISYIPSLLGTTWHNLVGLGSELSHLEQARCILAENPLIDGHNDLLIHLRATYKNELYGNDFQDRFENGSTSGHVDLPRTKEGGYGGAFWSAWYFCPSDINDFSDEAYEPGMRRNELY